ncbi:MAG: TlpA family protein disulfide reductase [Acidobacteriota bacterium]
MKAVDLNAATNITLIIVAVAMGGMATYNFVEGKSSDRTAISDVPKLVGETLRPFTVAGLAGDSFRVPVRGELPTVLYVFSSTCAACKTNEPAWTALADSLKGLAHAVAMSMEESSVLLEAYTDTLQNYRIATLAKSPQQVAIIEEYRLWATPLTFILRPDGKVEEAVVGAYGAGQVADLIAETRNLTKFNDAI